MLDLSNVEHIDLEERLDFNSSIRPLIDEKKLEFLQSIEELQGEFR